MPRLEEERDNLLQTGEEINKRAKRTWNEFADFALRDNVLEVAPPASLASAFTKVVSAFVSGIILPPISLLPFFNRNLDEKFAVLRKGPSFGKTNGYNTPKQAQDDGAVIMTYGSVTLEFEL
ncbi:MAG: hypothetical protein Q9190_005702 [Brigantiaea leucoxantha]